MPFVVRYMGHQNELEVDTRLGRRVFPRGSAVSMRGGEGQALLRQASLQFERVMPRDDGFSEAVTLDQLSAPAADPAEPVSAPEPNP